MEGLFPAVEGLAAEGKDAEIVASHPGGAEPGDDECLGRVSLGDEEALDAAAFASGGGVVLGNVGRPIPERLFLGVGLLALEVGDDAGDEVGLVDEGGGKLGRGFPGEAEILGGRLELLFALRLKGLFLDEGDGAGGEVLEDGLGLDGDGLLALELGGDLPARDLDEAGVVELDVGPLGASKGVDKADVLGGDGLEGGGLLGGDDAAGDLEEAEAVLPADDVDGDGPLFALVALFPEEGVEVLGASPEGGAPCG